MEKRLRWQWRRPQSVSWRIDETYIKVRGKWAYLYRALDKLGNTIDFYLSATRNTKAAKRFLGKALRGLKAWEQPEVLNTDKAPTYAAAIAEFKTEGKCPNETSGQRRKTVRRWPRRQLLFRRRFAGSRPASGRRAKPRRGQPPIGGMDSVRQILRVRRLAISAWRGTASTPPVAGLHHRECAEPSRFR